MNLVIFLFLISNLLNILLIADCEECIADISNFTCPTKDLPSSYIFCCIDQNSNNSNVQCCSSKGPKVFNVDESDIMIVSLTVMISCVVLAAVFLVCCFWSRCPLFDTCRVNYGRRLNIAYTKEEEALNLPPEDDSCSHYSPNIVIKPLDSDA